ncbi:hypothetical protein TNCV_592771 [Trichonephila clavipes]|nr:hypothetical protein TNCV_592771 [Trichonephila clavipes]
MPMMCSSSQPATVAHIVFENGFLFRPSVSDFPGQFRIRLSKPSVRDFLTLLQYLIESNMDTLRKFSDSVPNFVMHSPVGDALLLSCLRDLEVDEAHFWLNGYVNKQNYRIWSEANPQVYVETPLHPEKLTVLCALWAGGILLQKRGRPQRYSQW